MKEEWKKVKLERFFTVKKGQSITKRESNPGPYPVILGGREPAYYIDRYNHEGKAIVVSRSGASAGYVSFWNEPIFITDGFLIEPKSDVCYEFVYYLMKNNESRFIGSQKGAAIPHVTPALLCEVNALLPPLPTQQKIASILSAYDDLIENNRKQIKLLEEAAQKLYKEWFVKLNFPGHETTKIVDGVPEGWKKGVLSDIAQDVGKTVNKKNRNQFSYYLPIDCLPKKSLSYTTFNSIELAESSLVSFNNNDVIFGAMRPYFHKVVIARDKGLTRNTCFVINTERKEFYSFLVMLLFSDETIKYATKISVGTTMPYVRWSDFQQMPITFPDNKIASIFNGIVVSYLGKIKVLAIQIQHLQSARDKLLPRLMNGELEV